MNLGSRQRSPPSLPFHRDWRLSVPSLPSVQLSGYRSESSPLGKSASLADWKPNGIAVLILTRAESSQVGHSPSALTRITTGQTLPSHS